MLCDDLIAAAKAARNAEPDTRYIRRIAFLCEQGERFVLDNEAVDVIMNVEESRPSTLASALSICRLPHRVMWVEYDLLHRMRRSAEYGYEANVPKGVKDLRGALLMVADDDSFQRGRVYSVSHQRGAQRPLVNPARLDFDLTPENRQKRRLAPDGTYEVGLWPSFSVGVSSRLADLNSNPYTRRIGKNPDEVHTLVDLEHRFLLNVSQDAAAWLHHMHLRFSDDEFLTAIRASMLDFQGERRWIIGLLLMLNSRNLYSTVNHSVGAKNRQRSPRVHPRPFTVSHKTVKIELTRVGANRMYAEGTTTPSAIAQHKVRGHWKVRKTGVYFWRPHSRGRGDVGVVNKTYQVTR